MVEENGELEVRIVVGDAMEGARLGGVVGGSIFDFWPWDLRDLR